MITMNDIVREGHPALREVAEQVSFPLTNEDQKLAKDMMTFLKNSQDPELAEKYELRAGVGLAAPQLAISKRMIALLIPGEYEDDPPELEEVMFNPKIVSHSVESACLKDGEGCLSVDREVPGFVVRHSRVTVTYQDREGKSFKKRFKGYPAIVIQHEIDHLNGVMFYDYINEKSPFDLDDEVTVIG
ncbi:peptide deformylase [Jeotgalibaca caeni]|uniref:peptide deformylase n=1 Tax=Jeotgalibaca caeni TaxID=3028623 RepID=UPI00237E53B9|nr:peptide deformylase [Jeotgalibaca caeni]MDE1548417.1 peptide deformylase [Jeotgalibaca caeni]